MTPFKGKVFLGEKVLIIHYRVGQTDGVSIEINSWKKILKENGAQVALCAGPISSGADYVIYNLEQQLNPLIFNLDKQAFGNLRNDRFDLKKEFKSQEKILKIKFLKVFEEFKPTHIIVSNLFSVGEHLPAAGGLTQALDQLKIFTLAIHHDFYWENRRYSQPSSQFIKKYLKSYFPPKRDWLYHFCINSIAKEKLWNRKKIKSDLLYDTFDFDQPAWTEDRFNQDILKDYKIDENDLIVLQATRIVRRKSIELAIDFVKNLSKSHNLSKLDRKRNPRAIICY